MRTYRTSGKIAKDRLEELLLSEKMQADPGTAVQMKREIGAVIRKYVNAEQLRMDVQIRLIRENGQGVRHVKTIQIKGL